MADNDLIRRGDALALPHRLSPSLDADDGYFVSVEAINAIPAVQPTVKPLVWLDSQPGRYSEAHAVGILYSIRVGSDGVTRWQADYMGPWHVATTIEAAKAAAQADYEARILSALDMQPTVSPDVAEQFEKADWYWRAMDPDDCGDSPEEAVNRGMLGRFCVCEIASSYTGPTRYGFIAPVLDPESDDEEFVHFDTHEEAMAAAKERAALARVKGVM